MRARQGRRAGCIAPLLAVALAAAQARAQDDWPRGDLGAGAQAAGPEFPDPSRLLRGRSGLLLGLGFARIGKDLYAAGELELGFEVGPLGIGLAAPIDLLVVNDDGSGTRDSKTYGGLLRRRDWDRFENDLRVLRSVRYGHKGDELYLRAGELWGATLGHGTLVDRYDNGLNVDRARFGLALDANTIWFGVETLADSLVDPALLGVRGSLRPFGDTPGARGWSVGATLAADRTAPRALATALDASGQTVLQVDAQGLPIVARAQALYAVGVDTDYELLRTESLRVLPYLDLNRLLGGGNGLHAGVRVDARLPLDVSLSTRLELRELQAGYLPEYFDQPYDLGRYQTAVRLDGPAGPGVAFVPKAEAARRLREAGQGAGAGYAGELSVTLAGVVQAGGAVQDSRRDHGASLALFASLPGLRAVRLSGYYLRTNFDGFRDAFALDERSVLAVAAAVPVGGGLLLRGQLLRQWQLSPGQTSIRAVDRFNLGLALWAPF